jgi:hypothetical protein
MRIKKGDYGKGNDNKNYDKARGGGARGQSHIEIHHKWKSTRKDIGTMEKMQYNPRKVSTGLEGNRVLRQSWMDPQELTKERR